MKNTKEVFAVCVYSGSETKMSLNSKLSSIKFSTIERSLNKFLLYFLALLLVEMTFSMMMSLALGIEFVSDGLLDIAPGGWHSIHYHWYLGVYYSRVRAITISLLLDLHSSKVSFYIGRVLEQALAIFSSGW